MKISETYSHINGLEFVLVHRPNVWHEVENVVATIDAETCKYVAVGNKTSQGRDLYSSKDMDRQFRELLRSKGWKKGITGHWVTSNEKFMRKMLAQSSEDQRQRIIAVGETPVYGSDQIDFVKDRVAIEVQFGKYAFVAYDLFVKHLAFYVSDQIDVGIEILPMKALQSQMSSGVPYFEGEFYNVIRQGRGVPAVPLIMIGIEP